MGCIALVRCVLVLRCGLAVMVWYPYAGFSLHTDYNFSKEQSMLPADDRVIETCRKVLKCFNVNFRFIK